MASYREAARDIPVVREVDVLVVGGGTAGVPAALAAARLGARTLLVEKFNSFGGAITWGLTITLPAYPVVGPILNEILRNMQAKWGAVAAMDHDPHFVVLDQELYKYESLLLLEEAGVELLLNTFAVDAMVEDGALQGIIVENKSGRQAIRAKVTVDCTGDADIAFRAGAPTVTAPKDQLLPITLMWVAANVDRERLDAEYVGGADTVIHPKEINVWGGNYGNCDATDAWELTRAEVELRKISVGQWLDRRANWPGWEQSYIGFMAPHVGVRETRRIAGEYVVTDAEYQTASYEDNIGTLQFSPQFPYRALLPRNVDNLIVAGRCVSTEPEVQHSLRIAPTCALLGEAAGAAAGLSITRNVAPKTLDAGVLQAQLMKQGMCFGKLEELEKTLQ
ncbi:MAG: FAD-dependent oxidoreductase [Armatimonadota bacterium]